MQQKKDESALLSALISRVGKNLVGKTKHYHGKRDRDPMVRYRFRKEPFPEDFWQLQLQSLILAVITGEVEMNDKQKKRLLLKK